MKNSSHSFHNLFLKHTLLCTVPLAVTVLCALFHLTVLAWIVFGSALFVISVSTIGLKRELDKAFKLAAESIPRSQNQQSQLPQELHVLSQTFWQHHDIKINALKQQNNDLLEYKIILDQIDTALMLLNEQGRIVWMNQSGQSFFSTYADELPGLSQSPEAIETNLPEFLDQPTLLDDLDNQATDKILKINTKTFNLHVNRLQNLSILVTWTEVTGRISAEEQLQKLISKAIAGDFQGRLETHQLQGFMQGLSQGFNMLMDAVQEPLQETVKVQQLLAKGDLTHKLNGFYLGEFAAVKTAINTSIDKLKEVVNHVNNVSANIHQNLVEISQHNTDINARFRNQNDSLVQAAASLEQITSSARQNSEHTEQTHALTTNAHKQAKFGNEISIKLMAAMQNINDASVKVVDISDVIDEIAFQTNLLALNASIEAARAGVQGRGFAVVANEVKKLATRSAEAAKEIKALVVDNMEKIKTGSGFVDQTNQALMEISQESETINQLVSEISSAIQEEYAGINQINNVVLNIQSIAEDNTQAVNFIMEISEEVKQKAESLSQLMAFFTLEDNITSTNDKQLTEINTTVCVETDTNEIDQNDESFQEDDFFI